MVSVRGLISTRDMIHLDLCQNIFIHRRLLIYFGKRSIRGLLSTRDVVLFKWEIIYFLMCRSFNQSIHIEASLHKSMQLFYLYRRNIFFSKWSTYYFHAKFNLFMACGRNAKLFFYWSTDHSISNEWRRMRIFTPWKIYFRNFRFLIKIKNSENRTKITQWIGKMRWIEWYYLPVQSKSEPVWFTIETELKKLF